MNQSFGDWYRLAALEPNDELLRRRWAGIATFAAKSSGRDILGLVGIFCALPHDGETERGFRQALLAADAAFPMRSNDVELSCLGGAALAEILTSRSAEAADLAALALVCSDFRGLRRTARLPEIVAIADAYLDRRSQNLRADSPQRGFQMPSIEKHLATIQEGISANALQTAGPAISDSLQVLTASLKQVNDAIDVLIAERQLRTEESDVLWWLQGEYSRDLDVPLKSAPWPAIAIHVGKELSDIIRVLPGPYPIRAFLSRALLAATTPVKLKKEVRLRDAIEGFDQAKCSLPTLSSDLEPLCPVLMALSKWRQTGSSDQWPEAFSAASRLPAEGTVEPLDLALQTCREFLLLRAFVALKA
jgi:hypothetical protein